MHEPAFDEQSVFRLVDELEQQLRALGVRGEAVDLLLQLRQQLAVAFNRRSEKKATPCAP